MSEKITLSVLTWKSPETLRFCLESIKPIFDLFDERLIVCQEADACEIAIAEEFGFQIFAPEENLGIQGGMKMCFEKARNELVFFCENDLHLNLPIDQASQIFAYAARAMCEQQIRCTYLRYLPQSADRRVAGFDKYWRISDGRLLRRWQAFLRPKAARFALGKGSYFIHQSGIETEYFKRPNEHFLLTDSRCHPHENRALLSTRSHLVELIEFAEDHPTKRTINGSPDLEHPINCSQNRDWFIKREFPILIACPGVFGHRRYDRDPTDEKWLMVNPLDEGGVVIES